jgi:RNA polymerase sigma-70 factor (ECF subfamily)
MLDETPSAPIRETSDEDLMFRYRDGDESAFTELVRRYKTKIISTAYRVLGDHARAEDVAQETFLRVHRNADRYRSIAKFSTWIYTIALNVARNELRNTKRKRLVSLDAFGADGEGEPSTYEIPDESAPPDQEIENRELRVIFGRDRRCRPAAGRCSSFGTWMSSPARTSRRS